MGVEDLCSIFAQAKRKLYGREIEVVSENLSGAVLDALSCNKHFAKVGEILYSQANYWYSAYMFPLQIQSYFYQSEQCFSQ